MSKWWDVDVAEAGQALYSNPPLALNVATVPDSLKSQQALQKKDQEQAHHDSGGFLGAITGALGTADSWMSNIPGWGVAKKGVSYPIDKAAEGMRWTYSNVVSQPISTLFLHSAHTMNQSDGGWSGLFSGGWEKDWKAAEHISPGQAYTNIENTAAASGHGTDPLNQFLPWGNIIDNPLQHLWGDAGRNLSPHEKAMVSQNVDRFIYDTDYWRDKGGWKYDVGSGSLDFMFNMFDPVVGTAGGVAKGVKAARSVVMVPQVAEHAAVVPGAAGVARTRGPVLDLFMKQQTPQEVAETPSMQKAFDWMKEDNRTVEEIANHPMWGRGRRVNPARYDIARLIHDTPRDNMEQLWRFTAGDSNAAAELSAQAPQVLKKIGQTMDNRILLEGTKMNPSMISHFKVNYETGGALAQPETKFPELLDAPYSRPTQPGPRQSGWDATWGRLAATSAVNRTAAAEIAADVPLKMTNPAERTLLADVEKAKAWKAGRLETLADDYDELINSERNLGAALGTMGEWTPAASPLFGAVQKSYRMGELGLRSTEKTAQRATFKSARGAGATKAASMFSMAAVRNGMGAPMTIIHNFGNRTPQGFVDHNADDARDRVFDMLKQVKGLNPQARLSLIEMYNAAGNKMERSDALDKIHNAVMNHILINENGLHPDVANVLRDAIKDGMATKLAELTGKSPMKAQRFGPEATSPEDVAKLTGQSVDDLAEDIKPVRTDAVATEEDGHGLVVSPLAQTQLSSTDMLFPVQEINRLVARSKGSFQGFRGGVGEAKDWVVKRLDGFDNLWKASTLLRPGFIPRMVSDEVLGRMFKFGGLATLVDTGKGMAHFLSNRSREVGAIVLGKDYASTTSGRAIVSLDNEDLIRAAGQRGLPTSRIKVPPTLRMAYGRISDETDALKETQKELAKLKRAKDADPTYVDAIRARAESHQNAIDEYHDYVGEILRKAETSKGRRLGDDDFEYRIGKTTYRVPKAFSEEWDNPIPRSQISSENAWKALFSRGEMLDRKRFWSHAEKTGAYKLIHPNEDGHMQAWLDAVNKQIRQDPFHRMIAGGATDKEALQWLTRHGEGRKYMANLGYWNQDKPQFVRNVRFMVDKYLGDDALKAKLADDQVITEPELRQAFSREEFPIVHGEEIKQHSSLKVHETATHWLDKQTEKAWKMMADVPADVLSRHPLFLQMHQHEMENLIREQYHFKMQKFGTDEITPKEWEQMNQKAATRAKKQMSQVVYDPVNTVGSQGLRFVYPFFKPWIDGVDRWAGLVAERPEQVGRLSKIYNMPMAANLVTDNGGHHVDPDGYATYKTVDPITGKEKTERTFVPLKDRVLHLKAPWAKASQGSVGIRMASLNTIMPGDPWFDPGSGPIVQVPANLLAQKSYQAGDFLQWAKILPYGPQGDTIDLLTPKYMSDAYARWTAGDLDNNKYQQAFMDIYNMRTAEWKEKVAAGDKHAKPPTMNQIQKEAKHFLSLQILTDWLSPVSVKNTPLTGTKYQFFVDQFKALQAQDPANARDQFLKMHGANYIQFTAAQSESLGIAATVSAEKQFQKYKDLIAEDPDMAGLAIGDSYNGGPFSNSVYMHQFNEEVGGKPVRKKLTAEEAISKQRVQEGWNEYMATTKWLNSQLIRAGFTSYTQNGAEAFQQAKRNLVDNLSKKNPGWAQAFGVTDRNAIPNRIAFMEKLVTDPKIMNDPLRGDAKVLREYLIVRNQFKQQLAQRGLQQLSFNEAGQPAGQAPDIGYAWRQYQMYFQNRSLAFESLFSRYLENDDLQ